MSANFFNSLQFLHKRRLLPVISRTSQSTWDRVAFVATTARIISDLSPYRQ
uniref:Uncharacterized protein n=1 Tax=Anguilla anguilla TaxID=7936 RepID=A0A0E9PLL7_ANGAN